MTRLIDFSADRIFQDLTKKDSTSDSSQRLLAELAGTITSGVAGGVAYALISRTSYGAVGGLIGSAVVGAVSNYGTKNGAEHLLLRPEERDVSVKDFLWGAANGLSGGVGAIAEGQVSKWYAERVGLKALGRLEDSARLREAGFRMFESSLSSKYKANVLRGTVGGGAGAFAYSLPHSAADRSEDLKSGSKTASALAGIVADAGMNTAVGALTGGILGTAATTFMNRADVFGYTRARFFADASEHTKLQIGHVNDVHSAFVDDSGAHPFARLSTEAKQMASESQARGVTNHNLTVGDEFGGTDIDNLTKNGQVENETLNLALGNPIRTMGNHSVDKSESIAEWLRNTVLLNEMTGESNTVVSNVTFDKADLTVRAQKAGLDQKILAHEIVGVGPDSPVKPYLIKSVRGPHGLEQVGYIGLTTEDIDPVGVRVNDGVPGDTPLARSIESAKRALSRLHSDHADVKRVVLLSHLGRDTDIEVAKNVSGISAIIGAHSHDAQPVPLWVTGANGWKVPVVQAGNDSKWMGDLSLAFKPNSGEVDKYFSGGRLRPLTAEKVQEDPRVVEFLRGQPFYDRIKELQTAPGYGDITARADYPAENVRARQTALGTNIADGLMAGINQHLRSIDSNMQLNGFLKHSGDIRKPIPGKVRLLGWHFANMFCNGENTHELTVARMTGEDIRRALEYGVQDMPPPLGSEANLTQRLKTFADGVFKSTTEERPDHSGNFLQVSGVRYKMDLSQPPIAAKDGRLVSSGSRIREVEIWSPPVNRASKGSWRSIDPDAEYNIGTLFHPVDKWAKSGIWDDLLAIDAADVSSSGSLKQARVSKLHERFGTESGVNRPLSISNTSALKTRGLGLSQPRLMVDYMNGVTSLAPGQLSVVPRFDVTNLKPIVSPDNLGKVDGRILDVTPRMQGASWKAIGSVVSLDVRDSLR